MIVDGVDAALSLAKRVETRVRQTAHGRIRNLVVEEIQGQVVVSGQAPSRHAKQLALQGRLNSSQARCLPRKSRLVDDVRDDTVRSLTS